MLMSSNFYSVYAGSGNFFFTRKNCCSRNQPLNKSMLQILQISKNVKFDWCRSRLLQLDFCRMFNWILIQFLKIFLKLLSLSSLSLHKILKFHLFSWKLHEISAFHSVLYEPICSQCILLNRNGIAKMNGKETTTRWNNFKIVTIYLRLLWKRKFDQVLENTLPLKASKVC